MIYLVWDKNIRKLDFYKMANHKFTLLLPDDDVWIPSVFRGADAIEERYKGRCFVVEISWV